MIGLSEKTQDIAAGQFQPGHFLHQFFHQL